jgi:hypothetical protein
MLLLLRTFLSSTSHHNYFTLISVRAASLSSPVCNTFHQAQQAFEGSLTGDTCKMGSYAFKLRTTYLDIKFVL